MHTSLIETSDFVRYPLSAENPSQTLRLIHRLKALLRIRKLDGVGGAVVTECPAAARNENRVLKTELQF